MIQIHATQRLNQIEIALRMAAGRHGGSVLAASHVGQLLRPDQRVEGADAVVLTLCFSDLYAPLLAADIRFAGLLPCRIAVWAKGGGACLETISPREYCRMLHRPEGDALAASLEDILRLVMEEAAHPRHRTGDHQATEDQVNMRAALPQRIDCHGTKVEELAGVGVHDSQGG